MASPACNMSMRRLVSQEDVEKTAAEDEESGEKWELPNRLNEDGRSRPNIMRRDRLKNV